MRKGDLVVLSESDQRKVGNNYDFDNFKVPSEVIENASLIVFQPKDESCPSLILKDRWDLAYHRPIRM